MSIFGKKKHKKVAWFATSCLLLFSCAKEPKIQKIYGETQGTTYQITLVDAPEEISKLEIDKLLHKFDLSLSGYISNSTVSRFNSAPQKMVVSQKDSYFLSCFALSQKIYKQTDGDFDPTVLPLMELWGFLKDVEKIPNQSQVDSVKQFVGMDYLNLYTSEKGDSGKVLTKKDPRLKLDFNAIAQGYSVDVLGDYLKGKGCENFYVEIGGEILVQGKNPDGELWRLGVDKPVDQNNGETTRIISAVISLGNGGVATSGNYRKFYKKNGKIYAHTLNPKTGYPAENKLLSATVIAKSAAIADGMATAFMVMGVDKAKKYLKEKDKDQLEVLFIYTNEKNELQFYASPRMEKMLD